MSNLKLLAATMRGWSDTSGDHHMLAADAIEQLIVMQAERDALAAQVGRMSTFIKLSAAKWENCHDVYPTFWNLLRVANETPQQHLAEIRAQAGRDGYLQGIADYQQAEAEYKDFWIDTAANQYADSIRQEGGA